MCRNSGRILTGTSHCCLVRYFCPYAKLKAQSYTDEGQQQSFTDEGEQQNFTDEGQQQSFTGEGHQQNITDEGQQQGFTDEGQQQSFTDEGQQQSFTDEGQQLKVFLVTVVFFLFAPLQLIFFQMVLNSRSKTSV